ncbi:hypothetical protein JYU34_016503 [Plutella xylostella]|uniref:RING-type domain-containing protein n=2 Tax=Plutella xylostella TaxID=51655 RepID=A0ABQ7Q2U5_PLUXY|nr:hypothetical protein JYU34_016503 [Plutella xylostella]
MGDRKERMKKSLGITEYPWSSDDETGENHTMVRPNPSSSATTNEYMDMIYRAAAIPGQPQPGTSASSSAPPPTTTSNTEPSTSQASRRPQATRSDRHLFWSLLSQRGQADMTARSRAIEALRRDVARCTVPRVPPRAPRSAAPSAEPALRRPSPLHEIRGILALKKATRIPPFNASSVGVGQPSRNPLFTARPTPAGAHARLRARERDARAAALARSFNAPAAAHSHRHRLICHATTSGDSARDLTTRRAQPQHPADPSQPSTSAGIRFSPVTADDSAEEAPARRASSEGQHSLFLDEFNWIMEDSDIPVPPKPQESSEQTAAPEGQSASTSTEMSLEEEVLEVEPAAEATEDHTDAAGQLTAENVSAEVSAAAEETPQEDQTRSKKKREDKESTVVELNQCLLRLLECPVCLECMEPPMSQCRRGHLVCAGCRARLSACPVCRTAFSSVRNRAMEGVSEIVRYACRHGCGKLVRLRRRAAHEASCERRRYACPAPACAARTLLPHNDLAAHFQSKHAAMVKKGRKHRLAVKVNEERHENHIILALQEFFHLRVDVDLRNWDMTLCVAYIGPKNKANTYTYEVTVEGKHHNRHASYSRTVHCDLENASLNCSRKDCFYLSLDQAVNFLRVKNRDCDADNILNVNLAITKNDEPMDMEVEDSCES